MSSLRCVTARRAYRKQLPSGITGVFRNRSGELPFAPMPLLFPRLAFPDDRIAVGAGSEKLTYAQLAGFAAGHAARIQALGIQSGARVGVWTANGLDTIIALIGQALGGYVTVPLNPKLGAKERAHIFDDAQPQVVFGDPGTFEGGTQIERTLASDAPRRKVDEAPILILYTSGTTGAPKGAQISARAVAANIDALADCWQWTDGDQVVHALPLFHVHGLVLGLYGALRTGSSFVHAAPFDPSTLARRLDAGGTMLFAVPTMYNRLCEAAESDSSIADALRKPRLLVSGSAGLPVREQKRIEALAGRGVYERYGLTETLINCGVRVSGAPTPGYVGPSLRGVELRLVNDAREPIDTCDDATMGEVAVRTPSLFSGYLNRPDATAAVLDDDGWFYTGDLATRHEDGSIRIVGRKSVDLIKTGGFKVGAGEIEACLLEHPGVRACAVLGIPDDDLGERIAAFVVARDTPPNPDELIALVADSLTPHKRPREVHFVDALPRNAMGKVQKKRLLTA